MTSSSRETTARRRLTLGATAALLAAASLALAGWSLAADDPPDTDRVPPAALAAPPPAPGPSPATERPAPAPPAVEPADRPALPVPEPAPVDAHAATPEVVHGTLALPTLGVGQPLHEGVTLTAINRGPSHWPGTAMPGQVGNVVVAGHRTTYTRPFHDLDRLAPGDPLVFTLNDGSVWTYELTSIEIVGPEATHIVNQTPDRTATLFACHPKGSAAQRIVAHFRLT